MGILKQVIDWKGDGRATVHPPREALGYGPSPVRLGTARLLAANLVESRNSNHSAMGSTLWVVIDYCLSHSLAFNLRISVDEYGCPVGYHVELVGACHE